MLSGLKVGQVFLVSIRLFLETDFVIRLFSASFYNPSDKPLDKVRKIESYIQQFLHLRRVDAFMVYIDITNPINPFGPYEKDSEQVDRLETLEGNDVVGYDFHLI